MAATMAQGACLCGRPGAYLAPSMKLGASSSDSRISGISQPSVNSLARSFEGLRVSSLSRQRLSLWSLAAGEGVATKGEVCMGTMEAGIGVFGTKVGMLTWFSEDGKAIPCTVVGFDEGNIVTQVKTAETDGYTAVQVAYKAVREKSLTKPELGHLSKVGVDPMRHLQEFRLVDVKEFSPGQQLNVGEMFKEGDLIDVSGNSIGKGFAGTIKRHNFHRGLMTHGSKSHRLMGSIGAGTTPGRVYPGKKMPGHLGNAKTKIRKLTVVKVNPESNSMLIKGALPGKQGNLLRITPAKIVGKNIPKQ
eukprot:TRINITY_DN16286_c0_g1_i1.p1 TRINITY_DN16286_c0_g1~~TRINITY_DN16286_c0_g1_i1.p1  ORF type:complete len:304 (+),score=53.12 TRINITY_DN16286_c0_g1_i1:94-1005(+)